MKIYEILNSPRIPIASVVMTRQLKQEEATAAPAAAAAAPAAAAAAAPAAAKPAASKTCCIQKSNKQALLFTKASVHTTGAFLLVIRY